MGPADNRELRPATPTYEPSLKVVLEPWIPDSGLTAVSTFPARSRYVDRVSLPLLGPKATLAVRLFAELVEEARGDVTVRVADLTQAVGLDAGTGERSAFARAVRRLERHRLVQTECGRVTVRTQLAPVSPRDLARLPEFVQAVHHRLVAERT